MDRLEAMHVFVTVADLRGFAPAARKLRLSPSAVTRLIAALEEHLGARLLQRTTRQVTLTDVGTRYLERVRRILADVEEADGSAREERNRPSGRLVVSAPVGFGRLHVGPVMIAYLKRYPEVACELRLSDNLVNLVEDAVDVAVRIGHLADSSRRAPGRRDAADRGGDTWLSQAPWRAEDAGGIARAPDHRLRSIRELALRAGRPRHRGGAESTLRQQQRRRRPAICRGGRRRDPGAGLSGCRGLRRGRLRIVLAKYEQPALPIHIVYPTSRLLSAKVRAFVDLVVETAEWKFG